MIIILTVLIISAYAGVGVGVYAFQWYLYGAEKFADNWDHNDREIAFVITAIFWAPACIYYAFYFGIFVPLRKFFSGNIQDHFTKLGRDARRRERESKLSVTRL